MSDEKVLQAIVNAMIAHGNCEKANNIKWAERWRERLGQLNRTLPHGSGFDDGSKVIKATDTKVVITTAYHHMNEDGGYDGWTEHLVTVRPLFTGLDIRVSGRNRNDIKEYISGEFDSALNSQAPVVPWIKEISDAKLTDQ